MKITLENIAQNDESCFRWLINPKLNDFFFWHFHPEFELVFIEAPEGTRHVGEHISRFQKSDLVLIGSDIPHLNFDFGIRTDYQKTVLHIQPQFVNSIHLPELQAIRELFERSKYGVSFGEKTKSILGERFKKIHYLPYFEQFIEVLNIFKVLSKATDSENLHDQLPKNTSNKKEQDRLQKVFKYIDENYHQKISLADVANISGLCEAAFCRYFKKICKLTFTDFLNHYRINEAKRLLLLDKNITETCFEAGFESLSYFNRTFKKVTGHNPSTFKKKYAEIVR